MRDMQREKIDSVIVQWRKGVLLLQMKSLKTMPTAGELTAGESTPPSTANDMDTLETGVSSQTDMTSTRLKVLEEGCQGYISENVILKQKLVGNNGYPDLDVFRGSDKLVKLYTGLPSCQVLEVLLKFVTPASNKLTNFQQFIMVLMKLRLNLPNFDLAFRFKVSESTVSWTFNKLIMVFEKRLSPLIRWPSRNELTQTMF